MAIALKVKIFKT